MRDYVEMGSADRRSAAAEDLARIGLPDMHVEIVEYDPSWPAAFDTERRRLAPLLASGVGLHHFGSTAVPGLAADPPWSMTERGCPRLSPLKTKVRKHHVLG